MEAVLKAVLSRARDSTTLRRPFQRRASAAPPPLFSSSLLAFISCCWVSRIWGKTQRTRQLLLAFFSTKPALQVQEATAAESVGRHNAHICCYWQTQPVFAGAESDCSRVCGQTPYTHLVLLAGQANLAGTSSNCNGWLVCRGIGRQAADWNHLQGMHTYVHGILCHSNGTQTLC